jgi:hypothetical protein
LVNRFTDHLQVVTTNNYNTITISITYSSLEHTFWTFPGNGSNNGYSSASGSSPLFTDSRTELTKLSLCPLLISSQHGPHRKYLSSIACVSVAAGTCLPSSCPETALVVYPPISWWLRSNRFRRYSMICRKNSDYLPYSVNRFGFVMEKQCVFSALGAQLYMNIRLQRFIIPTS